MSASVLERPRRLEDVPLPGGDRRICRMIFDELCVLANGDIVCSCADPSGRRVYGNVFRDRLADVFDGHGYYAMRHWQLRSEPTSWCPVVRAPCGGRISRPEPGDGPAGRRVRMLQLEPIARCNLACPECPVAHFATDPVYRPGRVATLPLATMLDVVAQLPDLEKIIFYNFGEPFLHPEAVPFLRAVRERRPQIVLHTSTNGLALAPRTIDALAREALLDRMVFSIDGAGQESYGRYRVGGRFDRAFGNLEALAEASRSHGTRERMEIVWQYILFEWNDGDAELARARALAERAGVELRWVVTHTRGASQRFRPGSAALAELLGVRDPWSVATCDLRGELFERDGGIAQSRYLAQLEAAPARVLVPPRGRWAAILHARNASGHDWPDLDGRRFRVGVELRSETGAHLAELPAVPLPRSVRGAGGVAEVLLDGRAPERPGRYRLRIDVVEEGVAWFSERGSAAAAIDLEVAPGATDRWDAARAARTIARAGLGSEPDPWDLETWTADLAAGTPTATWIAWLLAARATDEGSAARADAAAREVLGLPPERSPDRAADQPAASRRGWTIQAPSTPSR